MFAWKSANFLIRVFRQNINYGLSVRKAKKPPLFPFLDKKVSFCQFLDASLRCRGVFYIKIKPPKWVSFRWRKNFISALLPCGNKWVFSTSTPVLFWLLTKDIGALSGKLKKNHACEHKTITQGVLIAGALFFHSVIAHATACLD